MTGHTDFHLFIALESCQTKKGNKYKEQLDAHLLNEITSIRDGPLEKLWGGGGGEFWRPRNFFLLANSLYEFFLDRSMNVFLGLIGMHNFFSFNSPLREYFFCTSPAPLPPPHKFSNGPSVRSHSFSSVIIIQGNDACQ